MDVKLILIPILFIFLRIWSVFIEFPGFYLDNLEECHFKNTVWYAVLVLLSVRMVESILFSTENAFTIIIQMAQSCMHT